MIFDTRFSEKESIRSGVVDGTATIVKYAGDEMRVVMPASIKVWWLIPFPTMPIASRLFVMVETFSGFSSMTTISWSSLPSCSTRV